MQRSLDIFRRIVEGYLATGEPVGSRNLSRLLATPLSPASVRNVMQALEESGLIFAPHTSAGRLPTETGLRFFVDALLEIGDIDEEERRSIEKQIGGLQDRSFEAILTEATTMLSGMSRGRRRRRHHQGQRPPQADRVHSPGAGARARGACRRGRQRREPRAADRLRPAALGAWSRRPTTSTRGIRGRTITQVKLDIEVARRGCREGTRRTHRQSSSTRGLASWGQGRGQSQLIVRGQANLLTDLSAAEDLERIRLLFADPRDEEGRHRHPQPSRRGRRRPHLHRVGEQAVLVVRLVDDRRAVPRRPAANRRRGSASSARPGSTTPASSRWWTTPRSCSPGWFLEADEYSDRKVDFCHPTVASCPGAAHNGRPSGSFGPVDVCICLSSSVTARVLCWRKQDIAERPRFLSDVLPYCACFLCSRRWSADRRGTDRACRDGDASRHTCTGRRGDAEPVRAKGRDVGSAGFHRPAGERTRCNARHRLGADSA